MKTIRRLAAVTMMAGVLVLPGCMSILQASSSDGPAVFGGVRLYGRVWASAFSDDPADPKLEFQPLDLIFLTLDAPLSLCMDFLLTPVSIPNEIVASGIAPVPYPIWNPPWDTSPPGFQRFYKEGEAAKKRRDRERRGGPAPVTTPKTAETPKKDEAPKDDVPDDMPKDDVPDDMPKDDVPSETPKDDVPDDTPMDDIPDETPKDDPPSDDPPFDDPPSDDPPKDDPPKDDPPKDDPPKDDPPSDDPPSDDPPKDDE